MAELSPEFSRPVRLDTIGDLPRATTVTAEAGERAALSVRFGLRALGRLEADATLVRIGEVVQVAGRIVADVVQACVATGEDVPQAIDEPFALRFVPEADGEESDIELEEAALDEIGYAGGNVDLGEAVAQTLALALDPYPRVADAAEALRAAGVKSEDEVESGPFAGLRGLLGK